MLASCACTWDVPAHHGQVLPMPDMLVPARYMSTCTAYITHGCASRTHICCSHKGRLLVMALYVQAHSTGRTKGQYQGRVSNDQHEWLPQQ